MKKEFFLLLINYINDSVFKKKFLNIISGNLQDNLEKSVRLNKKLIRNERLDRELQEKLASTKNSPGYQNMLRFRQNLPAYKISKEIIKLIQINQVILISGETGK